MSALRLAARWPMRRRGVLLATLLCSAASGAAAQNPSYPQIERGRYLATSGDCVACHTAPGGPAFAGGLGMQTPFGTIYTPNITPDQETGLGRWSADDMWRVLHEGRSRNGAHIYPAMPYPWTTLATREDSDAIYTYLRTLPAVERKKPANALIPPLNFSVSVAGWNVLYFGPDVFKPDPAKTESWNRGAYLVTGLGHCGGCHTPMNMLGHADGSRALQGNALDNWYAPDITNNAATGLGSWSADDITAYLGTGRNGRAIAAGPMADVVMHSTQHMTAPDLAAIAAYLKDQPGAKPEAHAAVARDAVQATGGAIFRDNCAACHGAAGLGASELVPNLQGDGVVNGRDPVGVLRVVLQGASGNRTASAPSNPGMPAFGWKLSDAEVAAVATYLRTAWGNTAAAVGADSVRDLRDTLR